MTEETNSKTVTFTDFKEGTTNTYVKTPEGVKVRLQFLKDDLREVEKSVSEKDPKTGEYVKSMKKFWEWDVKDLDDGEDKVLSKSSYPFYLALKEFFKEKDCMKDVNIELVKEGSGSSTKWLIKEV